MNTDWHRYVGIDTLVSVLFREVNHLFVLGCQRLVALPTQTKVDSWIDDNSYLAWRLERSASFRYAHSSVRHLIDVNCLKNITLLFIYIFVAKRIFVWKNNCFKLSSMLSILSDKILLERAICCFARNSCWNMLFKLLLTISRLIFFLYKES